MSFQSPITKPNEFLENELLFHSLQLFSFQKRSQKNPVNSVPKVINSFVDPISKPCLPLGSGSLRNEARKTWVIFFELRKTRFMTSFFVNFVLIWRHPIINVVTLLFCFLYFFELFLGFQLEKLCFLYFFRVIFCW